MTKEEGMKTRRTAEDTIIMSAEERAKEIEAERARNGIDPLAVSYKLHTRGQLPGWRYLWAKDTSGRMQALTTKGYQRDETCEPISQGDNSGGAQLVRMMIPESIYMKDFKAKQARLKEEEQALRTANIKGGLQQDDGAYGDINIGAKTVRLGSTKG